MNKRPETMTEQDRLLDLQEKVADKSRPVDMISIIIMLIVTFGLGAAIYIIPDAEFSEQENRYLQQFPRIQSNYSGSFIERIGAGKFLDRLIDGDFTSEMADYYADQFPMRDLFVGIKGLGETLALKGENNGVVIGSDGYIITRDDYPNSGIVKKNTDGILAFADDAAELGIPYTVAIAGRTADVMTDKLPSLFPAYRADNVWDDFEAMINGNENINYVSLRDPLRRMNESGETPQLYYRTDHHWTSWGAYYAYRALSETMGFEPLDFSLLSEEIAAVDFFGTTWSSAGLKWIEPDTMLFLRWEGDTDYTTTIDDSGKSFAGFYDRSYLDVKDKYSTFISGNNALVHVTKNGGENREKLLVIKDSFAHSMVPFLAYNYDLVIIDPRYYKLSVAELAANEGVDGVLVLCNMATMTGTNVFGILDF